MSTTKRIEQIKTKIIIINIINNKKHIYLLIIRFCANDLNKIYINCKTLINNVITKNKQNIYVTMFKCLKTYKKLKINNENKTFELFNYKINDYVINFIDNVKLSHEFIYFFFENKFQIFKIYIKKHFVNNFIQYS